MAESVQYYLERMIPELEALEKKKIFTPVSLSFPSIRQTRNTKPLLNA